MRLGQKLVVALVGLFACGQAVAEPKLDIQGFTTGMTYEEVMARTCLDGGPNPHEPPYCLSGLMVPHCNSSQKKMPDALDADLFKVSCWTPKDDSGDADGTLEFTFGVLKQLIIVSYTFKYGGAETPYVFWVADPDFKSALAVQLIDVISKTYGMDQHVSRPAQAGQPSEVVWQLTDSTSLHLRHASEGYILMLMDLDILMKDGQAAKDKAAAAIRNLPPPKL